MTIMLNGDQFVLDGPKTIAALLSQLSIDPRRVAVEHNLVVVKRDAYATTMIAESDEVEIVNLVGGGGPSRRPQPVRTDTPGPDTEQSRLFETMPSTDTSSCRF